MPWTASDAKSHNKAADTPAKQKKWATVANAALKTYKGDEGKAIAAANDAIGRSLAASIPSVPEDDDDKTTGKSKVQEARGPKKKSDDDDEAKDDASPDDDAGTEASTDEEDDEDKKKRKDDDDGTEAVADEDQTGASEVIALENAPASDDDQSNADLSEEQKKAGKKFRPRRDPMTEIRYRKMGVISLAPNSFNPETREVDAVVSTGMKVRRRDWDGEYDEVLEMSSKACNLGRMNAGAAVLDSHQWHNGIQSMLGSVVPGSARIDKGELVARVRFSRGSALAQRVLQDLQDGIQYPLSAGYKVHKIVEDRSVNPAIRTAVSWEPIEVSLVPVAAEEHGTGFRGASRSRSPNQSRGDSTMAAKLFRRSGETDTELLSRIAVHFRTNEPIDGETDEQLDTRANEYLNTLKRAEEEVDAEAEAERRRQENIQARLLRNDERRTRGGDHNETEADGLLFKEILAIGRQAGMPVEEMERAIGQRISVDAFRHRAFDFLARKGRDSEISGTHQPQDAGSEPYLPSNDRNPENGYGAGYGQIRVGENPNIGRAAAMSEALTVRLLASRRFPAVMTQAQREWCQSRELEDTVSVAMRVYDGKEKPKNPQTRNYLGCSIVEMAAECINYKRRNGFTILRPGESQDILARAWHSTSDFPGIFENALNKSLLARYTVAMPTYREIAIERTFNDFRPHPQTRAGDFPQPQPLQETGELRYGTAGESREVVSVKPYGVVFAISRQMMVNDDLSAIDQILGSTGTGILRFENVTFFNMMLVASGAGPTLLQDSTAVFAAGHNNYIGTFSGTNNCGPPTVNALAAARASLRKQKTIDGQILNIPPTILLTGALNETAADQMVSTITPTIATAVNPFSGKLRTVAEALIPPGATGEPWYVFADPQQLPCFVYGFLAGAGGPRVRTDEPFGVQGVRVSLEHDFGVGAIDYRGAYQNIGLTA